VGNEVLLGDVVDTNSNWLCRRLVGLGAEVQRVTTVPDISATVAQVFAEALGRGNDLVITAGGLGPTTDDLTLQAVAQALGRPLGLDAAAREWVAARFSELAREGSVASTELTAPRLKMATLPAGSQPLRNRVGAAPGVMLQAGATVVFCLPGVPAELFDLYDSAVAPYMAKRWPTGYYAEWRVRVTTGDESLLAPALQVLSARHRQVYLKSRASHFGPEVRFLLTLSARGSSADQVAGLLAEAQRDLAHDLAEIGVEIVSLER
jgi:molybdenum cofactor synthesis domain-containing protein